MNKKLLALTFSVLAGLSCSVSAEPSWSQKVVIGAANFVTNSTIALATGYIGKKMYDYGILSAIYKHVAPSKWTGSGVAWAAGGTLAAMTVLKAYNYYATKKESQLVALKAVSDVAFLNSLKNAGNDEKFHKGNAAARLDQMQKFFAVAKHKKNNNGLSEYANWFSLDPVMDFVDPYINVLNKLKAAIYNQEWDEISKKSGLVDQALKLFPHDLYLA